MEFMTIPKRKKLIFDSNENLLLSQQNFIIKRKSIQIFQQNNLQAYQFMHNQKLINQNKQPYKITMNPRYDSQSTADLESEDTQQQKHYRYILNKIYLEDFSAQKIIRQQLRYISDMINIHKFQKILSDVILKISRCYRKKLMERIKKVLEKSHISLQNSISFRDFYKHFEEYMHMINILNDFHEQVKIKNKEIQKLVNYIYQQINYFEQDQEEIDYIYHQYTSDNFQQLNFREILQNQFLKDLCSIIKSFLSTNTVLKQSKHVIQNLNFIVDCCFNNKKMQNLKMKKSRKKKKQIAQTSQNEEQERLVKYLNQLVIPSQRIKCDFDYQFLSKFTISRSNWQNRQ